ncbi:hypothetical protein D9756_001434 [Leucocoprinus leucothites]|uniref:Carbonic anhydrase n=1 Tax=Leucocoprinus leucothites TaxID=201217 RepID=A0A8H5G466_9AGAR|nr:hypothetical protein D9756_001434 [Leucoagaricus leucothites]
MSAQSAVEQLLSSNAQWAKVVAQAEPGFFPESAKGQTPHTLWIGCADSRVPESVITGSRPGDIFVHRNIANQFHPDDDSALAVLEYAVNFLGVKHVVIVGHSECGGAAACLAAAQSEGFNPDGPVITIPNLPKEAPLNRWLEPLSKLVSSLGVTTAPPKEALPLVVTENVKLQVENLCKSQVIVNAWTKGTPKGQDVYVHGWVHDLATGCLKDLGITRGPNKYA